jgi:hypothetical protein
MPSRRALPPELKILVSGLAVGESTCRWRIDMQADFIAAGVDGEISIHRNA